MPPRFEKNAPGDFYVEDGCCLSCGVMHDEAPDLLAWHEDGPDERGVTSSHCYVARQPGSPNEVEQLLGAMQVGDVDCLRYGGADPEIIARINELGLAELCDPSRSEADPPEISQAS